MPTLLEQASREAARLQTDIAATLKSERTERAAKWRGGRIESGAYRAGSLMGAATRAARTACKRYPHADLEEITMDLVEAALVKAPRGELPRVGKIGTDDSITDPRERDRAYLAGIARHRLADDARSPAAETESLDHVLRLSDLPSVEGLLEQAQKQAHTDPGLVDPDAHPVNPDVWRATERFPTRDSGRAALSNLMGTGATRAQLARQAGLAKPRDWHKSVQRGRHQLARLDRVPVQRWTAKDWGLAESIAHLVEAFGPDPRHAGIEGLLAMSPPTYRKPKHDRPWRTQPDRAAPVIVKAKGKSPARGNSIST